MTFNSSHQEDIPKFPSNLILIFVIEFQRRIQNHVNIQDRAIAKNS